MFNLRAVNRNVPAWRSIKYFTLGEVFVAFSTGHDPVILNYTIIKYILRRHVILLAQIDIQYILFSRK